jgi:enoyl-CoA hydratase
MDYKILKNEITDGVALITISRPQAMNALNSDFFIEFNSLLDELSGNNSVRVIVLTGEGKAFVAGADIAQMSEMNSDQAFKFSKTGQETFNRLVKMDIPVIAAVNGFALGGGCELAMACDIRIASKNAKFGQPELNLGLIPGYAGTQRLSRLTGLANALHLIISTEMADAETALRIGLVQKVTEPENLLTEVMTMAKKIAANGSDAAKIVKQVIRKGTEMNFNNACNFEAEEFAKLFSQPSAKEGMKAFLEKRPAKW